jgi:hypothetical protein
VDSSGIFSSTGPVKSSTKPVDKSVDEYCIEAQSAGKLGLY